MLYCENDLKKAIEDTRQMILDDLGEYDGLGAGGTNTEPSYAKMTPEQFYEKVLKYAKEKKP